MVPIEGEFTPEGKYAQQLKIETPELIRLMPKAYHLVDKKPTLDKEKNKYVSDLCNII